MEFPTCAGAVVLAYDLPDDVPDLKLTGEVVAAIFLGKTTRWNDPSIEALNPGVKLPDLPIAVACRRDGCRATHVFTRFLATRSAEFRASIGAGMEVSWPVGESGKGDAGVADVVQWTLGAIGYFDMNYADAHGLRHAAIRNQAGRFVHATTATVTAAMADATETAMGMILELRDPLGSDAYPISSFTYFMVRRDLDGVPDRESAQALVDFLWWTVHDGQKLASELDFAPLAEPVVARIEPQIAAIRFRDQPLTPSR